MPNQADRLSIWDNDRTIENWYIAETYTDEQVAEYLRKGSGVKGKVYGSGKFDREDSPRIDSNNWFYQLENDSSLSIEETVTLNSIGRGNDVNLSNSNGFGSASRAVFDMSINKPLPPIPTSSRSFSKWKAASDLEYMFTDAGLKKRASPSKGSPDNVSFENGADSALDDDLEMSGVLEDDASNLASEPATPLYDHETVLDETDDDDFERAGLNLAICQELEEKYLIAAGTDVAGQRHVLDDSGAYQKASLAFGFWDLLPSQRAARLLETSIIGDDDPIFLPHDTEALSEKCHFTSAGTKFEEEAFSFKAAPAHEPIRNVIEPRSKVTNPAKAKRHDAGSGDLMEVTSHASTSSKSGDDAVSIGKKRSARDSFATKSIDTSSHEDDNVEHLFTKKARISPDADRDTDIQDDREVRSVRAPSCYSLITNDSEEEIVKKSTVENIDIVEDVLSECQPIAPPRNGFSGQFRGMMSEAESMRSDGLDPDASPRTKEHFTFGDRLHPNYLFKHTNFVCGTELHTRDFTCSTAAADSEMGRILAYASEMSAYAAEVPRTPAEEKLRVEIHRECAAARLEGASVGRYRYYQGHLTVEEYREADVCICWDICHCTKLCTRFGDLICPCSKEIEILEH